MFKKVRYNSGECIVEAKILEEDGRPIDNFKFMVSDLGEWFGIMSKKYGIEKKRKDLDWAIK